MSDVWSHSGDAPDWFPDVASVRGRSRPSGAFLPERQDCWSDVNQEEEATRRNGSVRLPDLVHVEACRNVEDSEAEDGSRRA